MLIGKQAAGQVTPPLKMKWSPTACEYVGAEPQDMYGCDFHGVLFESPLFEFEPLE